MADLRAPDLGAALRTLSDPTRLRILALLEAEELAVGELSRALDMAQSRVSNHLRVLREEHLLRERHVGTRTFLRLERPANGARVTGRLWDVLREELSLLPEHGADRARLAAVLQAREGSEGAFFDRLAGEWDKVAGAFTTGRARERSIGHLLPASFVVADLGCGTGYMAESLVDCAGRVICVDRSEAMLAEARTRLERRAPEAEVEFRQGMLDALPIADAELDGLVCGMVLHHLETLDPACEEMLRVLKPGGSAAVLELAPHREEWMRSELGDRRLGLPAEEVLDGLARAGFQDLRLDPVEDHYRPRRPDSSESSGGDHASLTLYVARGRRPGA
jgi:ArsR family transcriptional regulator